MYLTKELKLKRGSTKTSRNPGIPGSTETRRAVKDTNTRISMTGNGEDNKVAITSSCSIRSRLAWLAALCLINYILKPAAVKKVNMPIRPGDRKDRVTRPWHDFSPIRAVAGTNGVFAGIIYHPEGNPNGYVQALLEPLDRETGQNMRQHRDMSSRPEFRRHEAAQRGEKWDSNHPYSNHRVMTIPGREQGSVVMTGAITHYKGGRKKEKRNGKTS